jgi:hypothetical protein
MMDCIDLIISQHDELRRLFEQIPDAEGAKAQQLFEQIADRLAIHATLEEKLFYPSLKGTELNEMLLQALEEHLSAKRLIADCLEQELSEEVLHAKLSVLCGQVSEHMDEEEKEMLPKARKLLEEDVRLALAQEMAALQAELEEEGAPREDIVEQTDSAPPL